jgi:Trypsin-like peptidase domain
MPRGPLLYGQAPSDRYSAQTADGTQTDISQTIFPIVTQGQDGLFVAIGTGFFVAENGIFVTAAHVVKAILDEQGNVTGPFGIFQFLPGDKFFIRPIHRTTRHSIADIAVGVAAPTHHNTTGAPMPNKILTLAANPPSVGSLVCTYAYQKTDIQPGTPQIVRFNPGFFEGVLTEHHPQGRDKVLLPGPCFRTTMVIHGGASGGPVIGPNGTVFAVNSTGVEGEALSHVSCISEVLDLAIPDAILPGSPIQRITTLRELAECGFVISR